MEKTNRFACKAYDKSNNEIVLFVGIVADDKAQARELFTEFYIYCSSRECTYLPRIEHIQIDVQNWPVL